MSNNKLTRDESVVREEVSEFAVGYTYMINGNL